MSRPTLKWNSKWDSETETEPGVGYQQSGQLELLALRTDEYSKVEKPLGIAVHNHIIVGKDGRASLKAPKLLRSRR